MDSRWFRQTDEHATVLRYEAPCVMSVLSMNDVEREVLYAGLLTDSDDPWSNIPD